MDQPTIAIVATDSEEAEAARIRLEERYSSCSPQEADIIVALGGDGFVLETLHRYLDREVPIYGMNCGTVGFLMNLFDEENLVERLRRAEGQTLHPLRMTTRAQSGEETEALAINEVSLFRESRQAAKIRIKLDGVTRMEELICDGVLVATAAGSTAYNLSAQGPIIPLGASLLALTPISAFRPRRWRGALLPKHTEVTFQVLEARKRPVGAVADFTEVRDVIEVTVREDDSVALHLLFDPEHNLEERIIKEQFQA